MNVPRASFLCVTATLSIVHALAAEPLPYRTEDCGRYMTQPDLNECASRNFEAADAALNRLYRKALAAKPNQKARAQLLREERAWIAAKEKRCAEDVGPQEEGGSIWPMDMANCQQKETDARIRQLQKAVLK